MRSLAIAVAAALVCAAPAAFAQVDRHATYDPNDPYYSSGRRYEYSARDWRNRDSERARVIETRPLYASGSAREECWNLRTNRYEEYRESSGTPIGKGAAIGAVAGGVLGHQIDHGGGTIAGALVGGLLGHTIERHNDANDRPDFDRARCRVVAERGTPIQAYDVRYEHQGREYVTRMDHDPGRYVRIGRDVNRDGTPMYDPSNGNDPYGRLGPGYDSTQGG